MLRKMLQSEDVKQRLKNKKQNSVPKVETKVETPVNPPINPEILPEEKPSQIISEKLESLEIENQVLQNEKLELEKKLQESMLYQPQDAAVENEKNILNKMLLDNAELGDVDKVSAALSLGADPQAVNANGDTGFVLALKQNHPDVINQLAPEFSEACLKTICDFGHDDLVQNIILNLPKDAETIRTLMAVSQQTNNQVAQQSIANSILLSAAKQGNLEWAKQALEHGADLNICDSHKETPLHKASYAKEKEMVQFLLESGANPHLKDKHQQQPHELTSNKELQKIFSDFELQNKSATSIQKVFKGYFYTKLKQQAAKLMFNLSVKGEMEEVKQLAEALKKNDIKTICNSIRAHSDKNSPENSPVFRK